MGLFIGLKNAQEFLNCLVIFLTLGGQSLPEVSEKSPFFAKDKGFAESLGVIMT